MQPHNPQESMHSILEQTRPGPCRPEPGRADWGSTVAEALLAWYEQNARPLPWRRRPDPYWIWVSEIMLQQTRLETALPYFHRFIDNLPQVAALAAADEGLLLKLWEGLGYYNRVRNMQKAARIMVERYGGALPTSYQQLLALPGIGEYTAGAIASTAYQIPVPAVDGNVLRVMTRLRGCRDDVAQPGVRRAWRTAVAAILPQERPGDFNQALMDLGASVCRAGASPRCDLCPLQRVCVGYREGVAALLPVKTGPKRRGSEQRTVLVLVCQGKVLLRRRPAAGLLAGLWEFPNVEGWLTPQQADALVRAWGIVPLSVQRLDDARHLFTHLEWQLRGYLVRTAETQPLQDGRWAEEATVRTDHALPSAFKAYTRHLAHWL